MWSTDATELPPRPRARVPRQQSSLSVLEASSLWDRGRRLTNFSLLRRLETSHRKMKRIERNHHHHLKGGGILASLGQALNFHHHHEQRQEQQDLLRDHQFQVSVRDRIKALHLSLLSGGLDLGWLLMALNVVTQLVREAHAMLPSDLPTPLLESDEEWLSEYLNDTVKLLDALNELRQVISEIEHRNMLLKLAASILTSKCEEKQQAKARKCIDEYNTVASKNKVHTSSCLAALEGMLLVPSKLQQYKDRFLLALYIVKVVSVVILGTVVSALAEDGMSDVLSWPVPKCFLWSKPLLELLHSVKPLKLEEARLLQAQSSNAIQALQEACKRKADINMDAAVESNSKLKVLKESEVNDSELKVPKESESEVRVEVQKCKSEVLEAPNESVPNESKVEPNEPQVEVSKRELAEAKDLVEGVELKSAVGNMEQGLQLVRKQADALFHIVITNRKLLLNCLRQL